MKLLSKSEKNKIIERLKRFGITDLNHLLIETGKSKIRGYTGSLSREELSLLDANINIDNIGLYLFKLSPDIRLTIDACHMFQEQITKNIIEVTEKQKNKWLNGKNLEVKDEEKRGFVILRYKDDLLGCGKLSNGRITNFVPKERRIKN